MCILFHEHIHTRTRAMTYAHTAAAVVLALELCNLLKDALASLTGVYAG